MQTRSLLFASALVLASAAGTLALNGIPMTWAAEDGQVNQNVQQQGSTTNVVPAANDRDNRRTGNVSSNRDDMRRRGDRNNAGAAPTSQKAMPLEDVIKEVNRQGYTELRKVEREGRNYYEVYARDRNGRRVELKVEAVTGKLLKREYDD